MKDAIISLCDYFDASGNINEFNAPHRYRIGYKTSQEGTMSRAKCCWVSKRSEIKECFKTKLKEQFDSEEVFWYAVPATRQEHRFFVDDLKKIVSKIFPNSIDISDWFCEQKQMNATISNKTIDDKKKERLSDEELKSYYSFEVKASDSIPQKVLLLDDVYSTGNTLRAMELAILPKLEKVEIIKAVVLKTTQNVAPVHNI
jgi:hypothetical protein